jgi:Arc/MetJ family transcription regulator
LGCTTAPWTRSSPDKRSLALLSLQASTAGYSPEEQAFIAADVPWTRLVAPGAIDWEGKTQPLAELLTAEQPRFVLKKAGGHGGSGVVLGRFVAPERWREALAPAGAYIQIEDRYTRFIVKRLVDIDDDLLQRAQNIAGTGTIKETVNVAPKRLVDDERVLRHIERLRGSGALDMAMIEEARRPRTAR